MGDHLRAVYSKFIDCHVFYRKENSFEFLLLKRSEDLRYGGSWQQVQGKIEDGETAWQAALREVKEESGLDPIKLWNVDFMNRYYFADRDESYHFPVFVVEVDQQEVSLSHEHSDFKWLAYPDCKHDLIWQSQKQALDIIYKDICLVESQQKLDFLRIAFND